MGRGSPRCSTTTVTCRKVSASSCYPVKITDAGEVGSSVSGLSSPCCGEHRPARGNHHQLPRVCAAGVFDSSRPRTGSWRQSTGPQSAFTTSPTAAESYGTHRKAQGEAVHLGGQGNRGSRKTGGDCSVGSVQGLWNGAQLQTAFATPYPSVGLPPWCRTASVTEYPFSEDGLTKELVEFHYHLELGTNEKAARERLLGCVRTCVDEIWGHEAKESGSRTRAQVILYGSYALGLSLPSSDIDLALTFPADEQDDPTTISSEREGVNGAPVAMTCAERGQAVCLERLHILAEQLQRYSAVSSLKVEVYDQCRVPRIHLQDMTCGGVSCDINSSFVSARVARIVARQRLWLDDSPLAAFLVRITKAAVKQWGLNEVFFGGVASTAVYSLVLRFLAQMEQFHQNAGLEDSLPPPRYEETTTASVSIRVLPLRRASLSSLSTQSLSSPHPTVESPTKVPRVTDVPMLAARDVNTLSAAAAAPSYVPSWTVSSKKHDCGPSLSWCDATPNEEALRLGGVATCTLSHSDAKNSVMDVDREADDEVDGYTQAGLTHSSCPTTTTNTPTSRTAASTPPFAASDAHNGSAPSESTSMAPPIYGGATVRGVGEFPSVEELTRIAKTRYGASPARLLLKFWRFLSADAFLGGYQVADAFGDDMAWSEGGHSCESATLPMRLPSPFLLERATFAGTPSADLSSASFRAPELQALFRASSTSLENMFSRRYPWHIAPTMLSTIFVNPRQLTMF